MNLNLPIPLVYAQRQGNASEGTCEKVGAGELLALVLDITSP